MRESAKTANKKDAADLLAKRRTEVRNGVYWPEARKAGLTLAALRDRWMLAKATKASIGADASRWKRIVGHFGEHRSIASLVAGDVAAFRDALAATEIQRFDDAPAKLPAKKRRAKNAPAAPRARKRMSPSAVNKHLVLLRAALKLALHEGFLHRSPAQGVALMDHETERDRVISREEYGRLHNLADADMRIALALGWWCGLRRSEIAGLTWDRVDFRSRLVKLRNVDTKARTARDVPMPREVTDALKAHPRNLSGRVIDMRADSISRAFRRLCQQAGVSGAAFHDTRHSAATRLRKSGTDVLTIAKIGGWADLESMRRYQTIDHDDLREAMDRASDFENER